MAPGMQSWSEAEGSNTFAELFKLTVPAPGDDTSSHSMRQLTEEEIHSSGPSLRKLETFDFVEQMKLGNHDYSWAKDKLSKYGPDEQSRYGWLPVQMQYGCPALIRNENSVGQFLVETYLQRALCGGYFLFSLVNSLPAQTRCPSNTSCELVDLSTSGASGRPDRQFDRPGKPCCCLMEFKTKKVCQVGRNDILDKVGGVDLLYQSESYQEDLLSGLEPTKKKATSLIYQVCGFPREIFRLNILKSPDMASAEDSKIQIFNCCP